MGEKPKILVVDDEEVVRLGIQEQLTDAGYEVLSAKNGKVVSELIQKNKVGVAFVDLWMPEMDGVETCKLIRKLSPETEVVLISGRPDGFGGREGDFLKAGGLDFFLYKPFREEELLATVKKVLVGGSRSK